ncbi:MAG: hypothetical protein AB7U73_06780 [Pirellulales bacterium]
MALLRLPTLRSLLVVIAWTLVGILFGATCITDVVLSGFESDRAHGQQELSSLIGLVLGAAIGGAIGIARNRRRERN